MNFADEDHVSTKSWTLLCDGFDITSKWQSAHSRTKRFLVLRHNPPTGKLSPLSLLGTLHGCATFTLCQTSQGFIIPCSWHFTAIPSSKMGLSPATGQSAEDPSTGAPAARLFANWSTRGALPSQVDQIPQRRERRPKGHIWPLRMTSNRPYLLQSSPLLR